MEPRRRRMRTTFKQLKLLVKFMADNPCLAKGVDYRTAFGKHYHDTKWTELANLMNAQENGMNKSPREWNRVSCILNQKNSLYLPSNFFLQISNGFVSF